VEWVALVLLAALVLTGAAALSGREEDRELGALVAKRIAGGPKELASAVGAAPASDAPAATGRGVAAPGAPRRGAAAPPAPGPARRGAAAPPALRASAPPEPRAVEAFRRLRGVSEIAKRAWIACLGYRRWRYELEHPTAPNEALPLGEALSIANTCLNPYDYFVEE
jgi:hypothetical protein